jgi:RNA ligase (TIGR02306 family)
MSEFSVEVVVIDNVVPHSNADALDVVKIQGKALQTIAKRGQYSPGDMALYVPYDSMVPDETAELWGVSSYLSKGRVRAIRLRGEMSYGFLTNLPDAPVSVGDDLSVMYGVTKYEPHPKFTAGENAPDFPLFHKYTSIENFRRYPDIFEPGDEVIATEKIHGTNSRVGVTFDDENLGGRLYLCGSHNMRKKTGIGGIYEFPLGIPSVSKFLGCTELTSGVVILFGEIYGWKVQDLPYGHKQEEPWGFRAFDISVDGDYLDYDDFVKTCDTHGIQRVPELYRGPFDIDTLMDVATGNTVVGGDHIREGIVIRPAVERTHQSLGRVVLKLINDDYITRKGGTEAK